MHMQARLLCPNFSREVLSQGQEWSVKVRSISRCPVIIAAHQTMALWGLTHACQGETIKVIVEPTEAQPYWSAATATRSLVCLTSSGSSNRIPVELTSNLPKLITLPQRLCWHHSKLPLKFTNTLSSLKMVKVSAFISMQET